MKILEEIVTEEEAEKKVVGLIAKADRLRMDYGGHNKIDSETLRRISDDLRKIWKSFRRYRDQPGFKPINFQITSAQAAITNLKSGKNPEANFKSLIEHLEILHSLVRSKEKTMIKRSAA